MEFPRLGKSAQGTFEGLKNKLGFGNARQATEEYDDEGGYDDQEYYDDRYDDRYDDYGDNDGAPSGYGAVVSPRLVSKEDVRANTRFTQGSASRGSGGGHSGIGSKRKIERASDYMLSTETSDLPYGAERDALYTPTRPATSEAFGATPVLRTPRSAFEPQENYSGAAAVVPQGSMRNMAILRPTSYSEVERVAKTLRAGDVVILCLQKTPDNLSKRILDFSFGVSSALDATVDCIADKVFVVIRGRALSEEEYAYLRTQGVFV